MRRTFLISVIMMLMVGSSLFIPHSQGGTYTDPEPGPADDGYYNLSIEGEKLDYWPDTEMHIDSDGNLIIITECQESNCILFSKLDQNGIYLVKARPMVDAEIYDSDAFFGGIDSHYNGEDRVDVFWMELDLTMGSDAPSLDLYQFTFNIDGGIINEKRSLIKGVFDTVWDERNREYDINGYYFGIDLDQDHNLVFMSMSYDETWFMFFDSDGEKVLIDKETFNYPVRLWSYEPVLWIDTYNEVNLLIQFTGSNITYNRFVFENGTVVMIVNRTLFNAIRGWYGKPMPDGFLVNMGSEMRKYDRNATSQYVIGYYRYYSMINKNETLVYSFIHPSRYVGMPTFDMDIYSINGTLIREDIPLIRYLDKRNNEDVVFFIQIVSILITPEDEIFMILRVNSISGTRLFLIKINEDHELANIIQLAPLNLELDDLLFRDLTRGSPTTGDLFSLELELYDYDCFSHVLVEYEFNGKKRGNVMKGDNPYQYNFTIEPNRRGELIYRYLIVDVYGKKYEIYTKKIEVIDNDPPRASLEYNISGFRSGCISTINFDLKDNTGLKKATLIVTYPSGSTIEMGLFDPDLPDLLVRGYRRYSDVLDLFIPADEVGIGKMHIIVQDRYDNINRSSIHWFNVTDEENPVLSDISDRTVMIGEPLRITSTASDNVMIERYEWTGPDGVISISRSLNSIFEEVGSFAIILSVWDTSGNSASNSFNITVSDDINLPPAPPGTYPSNITEEPARVEPEVDPPGVKKWNVSEIHDGDLDWMVPPEFPGEDGSDENRERSPFILPLMIIIAVAFSLVMAYIAAKRKSEFSEE